MSKPKADPTPPLPEEQAIEELADIVLQIRQYLLNTEFAPAPFTAPVDTNKLKVEFPKQIITKLHSLGYEKVGRIAPQGKNEQHIDDVIGNCIYHIKNSLTTSAGIVRAIRDAFKDAGYRSPSEVQEAERAAVERVFKEIEKVDERPFGSYYDLKIRQGKYQALKSELLGEQGK